MPLKKVELDEGASTQELILAIERKDRRFRLFQSLFMVGTFIALIFIISAQQRTLDSIKQQVSDQQATTKLACEQRDEQLNEITRRLNCMVVFFSTPNRDNLTIENIENCALNRDEDLNKFFQNKPNDNSDNPPNLPDSAPTAPSENDEARASDSGGSNGTPENTPPANNQRPPVAIPLPFLPDLPLCVPITNICVRP